MIYIAGPYKHRTAEGRARNVEAARRVAAYYVARGELVFCPHLHSERLADAADEADEAYWIRHGLDMLMRCDAIHLLPTWKKSWGAQVEALLALQFKKKFVGPVSENHAVLFHLNTPFHDHNRMADEINRFLKARGKTNG